MGAHDPSASDPRKKEGSQNRNPVYTSTSEINTIPSFPGYQERQWHKGVATRGRDHGAILAPHADTELPFSVMETPAL